jgi:acetylornithine deacetylase/succinyl-diaminopimelate desuccinylase-like protein
MSQALSYIDANGRKFVQDLLELIRIPSVSAVPEHKGDVKRCAEWLAAHLENLGLAVEIHPTPGHPLVYAEWLKAPGAPTVLIYGHYDVQPVDPLHLWRHPPFEGVIEGDNLIARGATDDKGQVFAHVKAIEAYLKTSGRLPVNVKLLIEGEEEVGSEHLDLWVADNRDKLKCDVVVISDTTQFAPGLPAITYGLRGLAYLEIRVDGPDRDLHSGAYGGAVANPANALCEIIAGLKDASGHIQVKGFYDKVRTLTPEERAQYARLPFDEKEFTSSIQIPTTVGEDGFTTLERRWARPTCDVNGLFGGYQGEGSKTVLPSWAGAKVSFRLVPDQDPAEIARLVSEHVHAHTPPGVRVTVKELHGGRPVLVPTEGHTMQAARRAVARGFNQEPVLIREGGSIPVVMTFQEILEAPTLLIGFGLNDDNAHSPNEKFNLKDYQRGIRTSACLLEELAV